jgi:hypothetical protein
MAINNDFFNVSLKSKKMKSIIIVLLTSIFFIGCSNDQKNTEQNVLLIEKYVDAVETENYNVMSSLLDDNYIGLGPSFNDSIGKVEALANWKANMEELYDKIEYQKSRNIAIGITSGENQGDWVSSWAQLEITYKGDIGSVIIWANTIYQIKNNKIVKSSTFYNEADALRQLGYVFINPNDL